MPAQFEQAELLKKQYTDKSVVVKPGVPELRRFQGMTGVVKTVNMSCRALVLFDGSADIGWYDIDPSFLMIVSEPQPKTSSEQKAPKAATEPTVAKSTPSPKPTSTTGDKKPSPLDLIRQQGAAGSKSATAPASGGVKPSPLDLIRQQGAAKAAGTQAAVASDKPKLSAPVVVATAPAEAEAKAASIPAAPKPAAAVSDDNKSLSPIELIRRQGAFKGSR